MPGFMRRTMSYLGLVEEYDDEYDDDYEYDTRQRDRDSDRGSDRGERHLPARSERPNLSAVDDRRPSEDRRPVPQVVEPEPTDLSRITTVHPRTYNDARTIGEQFRAGTPVIMNLTEMGDAEAKRLVDFSAGLIFGLRGSMDRVTGRVFLLSPPNVAVTAEDKARIAEGGFFNQS